MPPIAAAVITISDNSIGVIIIVFLCGLLCEFLLEFADEVSDELSAPPVLGLGLRPVDFRGITEIGYDLLQVCLGYFHSCHCSPQVYSSAWCLAFCIVRKASFASSVSACSIRPSMSPQYEGGSLRALAMRFLSFSVMSYVMLRVFFKKPPVSSRTEAAYLVFLLIIRLEKLNETLTISTENIPVWGRRDSDPHGHCGHRILSAARLPVPPRPRIPCAWVWVMSKV